MRIIARDMDMIAIAEIDMYTSAIWTDRYAKNGDFEICVPCTDEYHKIFETAKYITTDVSDRVMVIEKRQIKTKVDRSDEYIISGRSAETLLDRRVIMGTMTFGTAPHDEETNVTASQNYAKGDFLVWYGAVCVALKSIQTGDTFIEYNTNLHNEAIANIRKAKENEEVQLSEPLENIVAALLNANVINPTDQARRFVRPYWRYLYSSDPKVKEIKMAASFGNTNLYDAISSLLASAGIGCKVVYNLETETFDFSIYRGVDHSASQSDNEVVIFKPILDNIISTDFVTNDSKYKTCAFVVGDEDDKKTRTISIVDDYGRVSQYEYINPFYRTTWCQQVSLNGTGISYQRREIIIDADDIPRYQTVNLPGSNSTTDIPVSEFDYRSMLKTRGKSELMKLYSSYDLTAEILPDMFYRYMKDYNLGDTISIEDRFGTTINASVTELIFSMDSSGYKSYPTIESLGFIDGMDELIKIFVDGQIYVDENSKMVIPDIRQKLADLRSKSYIAYYVADIIDYYLDDHLIYTMPASGGGTNIIVPIIDDMDVKVLGGVVSDVYDNPTKYNNISTRAIQFVKYMMDHQITSSGDDIVVPPINDLPSYVQ